MKKICISQSITHREEDSLEKYLDTISKEKMISPDEEVELAHRIRQGDEKALSQLVRANLRFVVTVAKTYQNQGLALADLISEGNVGLITAARRFDETRGFKFISYAVWWIRQAITTALTEQSRMIRLPNNQNTLLRQIYQFQNRYQQEHGYTPAVEEIALEFDVTEQHVRDLLQASSRSVSFDAPLTNDEDGGTLLDVTAEKNIDSTDAQLDNESLAEELRDVFRQTLKDRDIYVITHSFGIGCKERSQEEIGMDLGLTRERVRQIRERAIQKLRNSHFRDRLLSYCG